MKVCVVGAGAIGGLLAVKLALAGETVSVIDRGPHLAAIRSKGLHLHWQDGTISKANVKAFDRAADAGKQDLVVLGVKAYDLERVAEDIEDLLGAETVVMTVQNGIPWWYFQKEGGSFDGKRLETLDPNGILSRNIHPDRIIGCVAYPAAGLAAPGVIEHVEGERFPVGELDGARDRTRQDDQRRLDQGRTEIARDHRHSRRDLAQGLGQPHLQSDQRAQPRDHGRHLPLP